MLCIIYIYIYTYTSLSSSIFSLPPEILLHMWLEKQGSVAPVDSEEGSWQRFHERAGSSDQPSAKLGVKAWWTALKAALAVCRATIDWMPCEMAIASHYTLLHRMSILEWLQYHCQEPICHFISNQKSSLEEAPPFLANAFRVGGSQRSQAFYIYFH